VYYLSKAYRIHINGIVQGVGFRPFVYRLAKELDLRGWVKNLSDGVEIHIEGENVELFCRRLLNEKPPLACIYSIEKTLTPEKQYSSFTIVESQRINTNNVNISPDIATCNDCLRELFDPADSRYLYPFINCTNCGPRYTIIFDRPYDRCNTTMKNYIMCKECKIQYNDPEDRRFHAQPVACFKCGPHLELLNHKRQKLKNCFSVINFIEQGAIVAVKGLGGFHLVCNAYDERAVKKLRMLKERGSKPFALMVKNLETAATEVIIDKLESEVLSSPSAPIVLLQRRNDKNSKIAKDVAPGLHTLGIMLPYTPVHHLLFQGKYDFLVMTSANLSGMPLIYKNNDALEQLHNIVDYFLLHDRDIYHPCDDSVVQIIGGQVCFHRRARGYVPVPIFVKEEFTQPLAGLGGEMKNAFCLAFENKAYVSQYIGDMHGYENYERFKQEYYSFQQVVNIYPEIIAYDLHPDYTTTRFAQSMDLPKYPIQHHHAHLVSVMSEYGLNSDLLGVICDGTGYGLDGKTWGFEFMVGNAQGFVRKAHLEYMPLPGGDAGVKHPVRIAYAYLKKALTESEWEQTKSLWQILTTFEKNILEAQLKNNFKIFYTSSAGRLFDVVSGILGICTKVTYEGQAAIELESRAALWQENQLIKKVDLAAERRLLETKRILATQLTYDTNNYKKRIIELYNKVVKEYSEELFPILLDMEKDIILLRIDRLLYEIVRRLISCSDIGEIAYRFHYSLALSILETAMIIGIIENKLVVGGGVFQNKLLTEILITLAQKIGVSIVYPTKLPIGDGGIAFGQAVIINNCNFSKD